jgi:hypothetical protein
VVFIEAISIPAQAKLTVSIADPWEGPESALFTGPFDQGFFTDRGHGVSSIFGGPQGKNDYYRYSDLPTGESTSYYLNGRYGASASVEVDGKTLRSSGYITVSCT